MRLKTLPILAAILAAPSPLAAAEALPPADSWGISGETTPIVREAAVAPAAPAPREAPAADVAGPVQSEPSLNPRMEAASLAVLPDQGAFQHDALRPTFADDPYAPNGFRMGSFLVYPAVDFGTGYTTNATESSGGKPSMFGIVAPAVVFRSDWSRNEVMLALRGSYEAFANDAAANNPSAEVEAASRLDIGERSNATLHFLYTFSQEDLSSPDTPQGAAKPPHTHEIGATAAFNQALGPGSVKLEAFTDTTLHESKTSRDNTIYGTRLRVGYALTPGLIPFVQGELAQRTYPEVKAGSLDRASNDHSVAVGVAFDRSPVSQGEIAIGYADEVFDQSGLATLAALTVDASLVWSPTELTTVTAGFTTNLDPTTDKGSSGAVVYDGSLDFAYAYRRNATLDATLDANYKGWQGIGRIDWTYKAGLATTWRINRNITLKAGYLASWLDSTDKSRNYVAQSIRFDLDMHL